MNAKAIRALVVCATALLGCTAFAADETCAVCDRKIVVAGDFCHSRGQENPAVQGAARQADLAFLEDVSGKNFTVSIQNLPAGRYTLQIGLAEMEYTNTGRRVFDITCGDRILASQLDIVATAGGAGRVLYLTNEVDLPGDALGGPLTVNFTGRIGTAKLNTFEVRDAGNISLISMRAADLVAVTDMAALKTPVINGPQIWKDPAQPVVERVRDLVSRLSLAEKVQEMRNSAAAIPRLGLPAYDYWNECLHGVARAGPATVFPQAIGMAATWDVPLVLSEADIIATEARAKHNDFVARHDGNSARYYGLTFWTPNINIFRDPRWGRGQETYGEDPFLTARLGVSFIRGLQGDDPKYIKAMACAKHFAVHSGPESTRHVFDADVPERDFYETYLPQFEAAVREGKVGAVMGAYNAVYGRPACANPLLLTKILRRDWGFDGHVVSDCGAIYDIFANHKFVATPEAAAAAAVQAGDDLCCGADYNPLIRAVKEGLISEKEIDVALGRLFAARFRLGMFDAPGKVSFAQIPIAENDTPAHEAMALKVARESIVLLKNKGVLPLDRTRIKRIAVIGGNADSVPVLLGNYNGMPTRPVTVLDGIRSIAGTNIEVIFEPGCPLAYPAGGAIYIDSAGWMKAVQAAWLADAIIYVGGISPKLEGEEMKVNYEGFSGGDRSRIELPEIQTEFLQALQASGRPVVFVNCSGSAMAMPWEAENLPAIVQAWYPGEQGGRAVAEVLFGDVNPAGRLPVTFYCATKDLPAFDDYSMDNRTYRYFQGTPLFAFGHGLSYTKFDYSGARLNAPHFSAGGTVKVLFTVKNSGERDGDEVAQVYFRHVNSAQPQAKLALCGFARIHLGQGQAAHIALSVPIEYFRYWDILKKAYTIEPGDYEILIGASSDDIRGRVPLTISAVK